MTAFPSARAQIVEARTYLRPLDDMGTVFETPEQAAERIISHQRWLWQRAKGGMHKVEDVADLPPIKFTDPVGYKVVDGWVMVPLTDAEEAELQELKALFLDRKLTVAGRTRWLGGTQIAKERESSQFNPLSANTAFVTSAGVRTFEDFEDGDHVSVLTHEGRFRDALVSDSGMRKMLKLHLRRGRTRYTQRTSVEHTWIKIDGTRIEAQDLSVGDKLWRTEASDFFNWDFSAAMPDEQLWWCYGFVYGDGTIDAYGRTSRVRLCGNKTQYLPRFTSCGFEHSYPPSCGDDPFVYTGHYLKTLPTGEEELRLIAAFLRGFLAADGQKVVRHGRESVVGITTTSLEAADFIRTWLPVFGVYILSDEQDVRETNYGAYAGTRFSFTIGGGAAWCVEAIEEAKDEHCWCLTVNEDHSFVLSNGVVTGNCSFLEVRNVHDIVDATWLLLQGCGVGFRPVVGTLNGFAQPMEIEVIRSQRGPYEKGPENNVETFDPFTKTWTIKVGDSSSAWAKSAGKLVAGKFHAKKLVLDFSLVRGGGGRLKNYGWISSGDAQIVKAYIAIAQILNGAAGRLLSRIEILDIMNWLGTILSSRRSAEIAVMAYGEPEWEDFALAKKDMFTTGRDHRQMSNNSIMFYQKPTKYQLSRIFKMMMDAGGSEPGFINAVAAQKRAPWFKGVNPCCEIMLGDRSFCNLVETVVSRFNGDEEGLHQAHWLVARANYRQTCVNLDDGVLQRGWHELNEFLRLCGVGVTGVVSWEFWREKDAWKALRKVAIDGANSMADELGLPRAKAVTTIKPSGTQSKAMGIVGAEVPEGIHMPTGRYIFNRIRFSAHDPIIAKLRAANYTIEPDPSDETGVLAVIPVEFFGIKFDEVEFNGKIVEVNNEKAVDQLDRYKLVMDNYVDHNASITVYYSPDEVPDIVDWLMANWDSYVGVSFIYRQSPLKTAADLGYNYLPQTLVDEDTYKAYADKLLPVYLSDDASSEMLADSMECAGGACPVR